MSSIENAFSNPVIAFFLGFIPSLTVALVIEYVKYYHSKIRSREESLIPYLRKMHGNISKMLEKPEAKNLERKYNDLQKEKINQKMLENARQQVIEEDKINYTDSADSELNAIAIKELLFLYSYRSLEKLYLECTRFESVHEEMENEGLIETLKVKYDRLYSRILLFNPYAATAAYDAKRGIFKSNTIANIKDFYSTYHDDSLHELFLCNVIVYNIFNFGSDLEKELRKFL